MSYSRDIVSASELYEAKVGHKMPKGRKRAPSSVVKTEKAKVRKAKGAPEGNPNAKRPKTRQRTQTTSCVNNASDDGDDEPLAVAFGVDKVTATSPPRTTDTVVDHGCKTQSKTIDSKNRTNPGMFGIHISIE